MDCRGLAPADAWRPPAAREASLVCQAVSRITSPFLATLHQLFPVTRALPPRSYVGSDLIGNLHRRVSGVSAARVDVDNHIVSERQRASTAPAGGTGVLLSRGGAQCAVRVRDLPDGPLRLALGVGVLAAGRPLLGGGIEEGAGFFHGRK